MWSLVCVQEKKNLHLSQVVHSAKGFCSFHSMMQQVSLFIVTPPQMRCWSITGPHLPSPGILSGSSDGWPVHIFTTGRRESKVFCSKIEIWWHSYFLNLDLLTQSPTLNRWFIAFQILLRVTVVEIIYTTGFKFKFSILTSQGYTTISWENQLLDHGSSRLTGDIVFTFWCTCSWIKPFLHTGLSWKSHFFKLPSNWVFKYSCNLAELIFSSPRYKYLFSACLLYIPYLFSPVIWCQMKQSSLVDISSPLLQNFIYLFFHYFP